MFIVMCRVSGGVTGTREAELKRKGNIQYFETREEAEQVANDLNTRQSARWIDSTADFKYWVEER